MNRTSWPSPTEMTPLIWNAEAEISPAHPSTRLREMLERRRAVVSLKVPIPKRRAASTWFSSMATSNRSSRSKIACPGALRRRLPDTMEPRAVPCRISKPASGGASSEAVPISELPRAAQKPASSSMATLGHWR